VSLADPFAARGLARAVRSPGVGWAAGVADAGSSELAEVGGGEERGEGDAGRPSEDNDLVAVVSVFGGNCAARLLADRQSACDPLRNISRVGHHGPADGWQMRHASRFIFGITSLLQSNSVGEGHALN
jgi:hypothetical protein